MKVDLNICENPNCGHILGCFPIKKCKFCGSTDFSTHKLELRFAPAGKIWYYHKSAAYAVLKNYKGADHLIIRVKPGEGNDCDKNGGYIHYMMISDADEMEKLLNEKNNKREKD